MSAAHAIRSLPTAFLIASVSCMAAETGVSPEPITGTVTGYYYAMRDQPDYGVGVAALNRGALHLEARYNYEAQHSASILAGWNLAGGDGISYQVTPLLGALFGQARGLIPGVEASVAYREIDFYVEAEYVHDLDDHRSSFWYAWSELGWKPAHWLRVGLVGQRSRDVETGRDVQRGAFVQFIFEKLTIGIYGFNPESNSRYMIVSLGTQF